MSVHGIRQSQQYLNRTGKKLGKQFSTEMIKRGKALSIKLQQDLSAAVDKGAVPFTNRAILFMYRKNGNSSFSMSIRVKDLQAKYLYEVLVKQESVKKFVPTSAAKLNKYGNITGLQKNLKSGRFKVSTTGGKKRLIDTNAKKKNKRVIGLEKPKTRKIIFDFYKEADKGARLIISDVKGVFKVTKK